MPAEPTVSSQARAGDASSVERQEQADALKQSSAPKLATSATAQEPSIKRYFECASGGSNKFWEITISGNSFSVRFGRIGTAGQIQAKTFSSPPQVQAAANKLISEKTRKGYIEKQL
jgi:predicted DNA-binding WGR domain protein